MVRPISGQSPSNTLSAGTYQAECYQPIPLDIQSRIISKSFKEGCPIPMGDLAYLQITHFDMDGGICMGELIVHMKIAMKIMEIFRDLHEVKFPIEKMQLIDDYDADDDRSMEANNSSAFCYRSITGQPGIVSKHGLGLAIDLNTRMNPYVKGDYIAPSNGKKYTDRSLDEPGMIHPDSAVVRAFKERGFEWGGDWTTRKDYQHFEMDPAKVLL